MAPPASDNGWLIHLVTPDGTYELYYAFSTLDASAEFPDIRLSPEDTVRIQFVTFNECLPCGGLSAQKYRSSNVRDTLFIYSNDESRSPYPVPIDFSLYVSVEEPVGVAPSLDVQVYPNPFRDRTTLEFFAAVAGVYEIRVFDVLGRQVYQRRMHLEGGAVQRLNWPEASDELPGGMYFVQVTDGQAQVTRAVTLVR